MRIRCIDLHKHECEMYSTNRIRKSDLCWRIISFRYRDGDLKGKNIKKDLDLGVVNELRRVMIVGTYITPHLGISTSGKKHEVGITTQ